MKKILLFVAFMLVSFMGFGQSGRTYMLKFKTQGTNVFIDTREVNGIYITAHMHTLDDNVYGLQTCSIESIDTVYVFPLIVLPTVITCEVTNVTTNSALASGQVTDEGSSSVTERGVCWSTSHDPAISDSHASNGGGIGFYTINLTSLAANTTYYVRAYATSREGTAYGDEVSFTTFEEPQEEWVDLGLPSGLLWATCNVGASFVEDYGDYFAWAETQPKDDYTWSNYIYCCHGNSLSLTKYCNHVGYGCDGYMDTLTILEPGDDAATANWGNGWRTPTKAEWQELFDNCSSVWTTQNGVNGRLYTGPNGNTLFLPAAGSDHGFLAGSSGFYRTSMLLGADPSGTWNAWSGENGYEMFYNGRSEGISVRAVRSAK